MKPTDFVILLIRASGRISGRTLLQKRAFFASELAGLTLDDTFVAHYYGPYSPRLDAAIANLKALGFVEERMIGFGAAGTGGFEIKRYDYRLTEDGENVADSLAELHPTEYSAIVDSVEKIKAAGDPNYFELSIAAKAYYILRKKARPMNREQIMTAAESFDWNIQPESLEKAVSFLENLGLTRTRTNAN